MNVRADAPHGQASSGVAAAAAELGSRARPIRADAITEMRIQKLEQPSWVVHRVAPRERFEQIAYRYGVEEIDLRRWNKLFAEEVRLRPKKRLRVRARRLSPARTKVSYRVQASDTWRSIAAAHGVSMGDLRSYNWRARARLVPGEDLKIWVDPVVYNSVKQSGQVVGSVVIPPGGIGVGPPNSGRIVNAVQLPDIGLYSLKRPQSAYGTSHAVAAVVQAFMAFRRASHYEGEVIIGTMSRLRGGPLGTHKSHQSGRDLDVRLPLRKGLPSWMPPSKSRRVDWKATWDLIEAFASTGEVVYIFLDYYRQRRVYKAAKAAGVSEEELGRVLQYPRGSFSNYGVVRHSSGHKGHIHVRVTCGPTETECVTLVDRDDKVVD